MSGSGLHNQATLSLPLPSSASQFDARCMTRSLFAETLLHSSFVPIENADWIVPLELDGELLQVHVIKRPWVDYFMEQVGRAFEVVIFTASLSKYADAVINLLDTGNHVRWRLYRDSCCPYAGNYVKDIEHLGREMSKTILVDNSPHSYLFQPENALPISTFIDSPKDRALLDLLPMLLQLESAQDVRESIKLLQCPHEVKQIDGTTFVR